MGESDMSTLGSVNECQVEVIEDCTEVHGIPLGYGVRVTLHGEEVWSETFKLWFNRDEAYACGCGFVEGMKQAYKTGYPGAANYVLGAGQWPGAQANVGNDSPVLCKQRPGEWFTTWLVRLARETAMAIGDREGEDKWQVEYERCSEEAK